MRHPKIKVDAKKYCPALEKEGCGQTIEMGQIEATQSDESSAVCGSVTALQDERPGTITLVDEGWDGYLGTTGPYRIKCIGCSGLRRGFNSEVKPEDVIPLN